ncbi:MAG: hypothetical protein ICV79_14825 [Flavisolibacter sp.]|nr:hypothetical protein [Flavisolibacter sp.]
MIIKIVVVAFSIVGVANPFYHSLAPFLLPAWVSPPRLAYSSTQQVGG